MSLDAARFRKVKELFADGMRRPRHERDAWLAEACADDPTVAEEVRDLLAADGEADLAPAALPERIGEFRILRRIGEGGMGTVYEAEQDQPRRRVALKVMAPLLANEEAVRRFRYETEILGQLDHPNIARIHAAGVEEGRPWFAMELVRGVELTEYARRARLSPPARLALLGKVCDAVQHAHNRGIVHRDLKPANILVDEKGEPRLLDFGLAKLVGGEAQMTTLATQAGQLLGTVPYMAPEQVAMDSAAVDLRTDVYALGVIAYELLAGRRPLDLGGKSLAEALVLVRQQEAPRLGSLHTQWRGDVETIIAKALEKDKERRYPAAGALGADIGRYLRHEPIVARPPTATYHLRKFMRRHRALVAGLVATFLILAAGVVVSTIYYLDAKRERTRFLDERNEARRQEARANDEAERANRNLEIAQKKAATASRALDFIVEVFQSENPYERQDEPPTTREVLDRAERRVNELMGDEPELQTSLAREIGRIHASLGDDVRARRLYERALEAARRVDDDDFKPLLLALDHLAGALEREQDYERAGPLRRELLQRAQEGQGGDEALCAALVGMARYHAAVNEPDEAEKLFRAVLAQKEGKFAAYVGLLIDAREGLARIARQHGRIEEAEQLLREAVEAAEHHPDVALRKALPIRLGLAHTLEAARKNAEALAAFQAIADTYLPLLDPDLMAAIEIRVYLGNSLASNKKFDEAIEVLGDCLSRVRRTFGDKHPSFGFVLAKYVEVCWQAGRLEGLEPLAQELVERQRAVAGGRPDYMLGGYIITLANVIAAKGEPRRAIPHYLECLELIRSSMGIETAPGAHTLLFAMRAYLAAEEYGEALPLARESLAVQEKVFGKKGLNYALAVHHLGIILFHTGDLPAAEQLLREARELFEVVGPDSGEMATTLECLAGTLAAQHRADEAAEVARAHVAFAEKNYAADDRRLLEARQRLEDLKKQG